MAQLTATLLTVLPWILCAGPAMASCGGDREPAAGRVKRLTEQLDSQKFLEREAAAKELRDIGEPAVAALLETARRHDSLETRRRAEAVVRTIRQDTVKRLVARLETLHSSMQTTEDELRTIGKQALGALQESMRKCADFRRRFEGLIRVIEQDEVQRIFKHARDAEKKNDYEAAVGILNKAIEDLKAGVGDKQGDVPLLTEAYMQLAGVRRKMGDFNGAARAYDRAAYYSNYNREKRGQIERACAQMVAGLMPGWEKSVRARIAKNAALKALAAKYPLVLVHSRRFAGGGYLQSCYSFIYETTDENKHRNDVQLQFDNGRGDRTFQVNMVGGQRNAVTDLCNVDFEAYPLKMRQPSKVPDQQEATAIENHVYLEKVEDANGNSFLVLFQIVAVDPDSRYMAFIWRRLPGGKLVRQN